MHVSSVMVLYHVVKTVGTDGSTWEPALQMQTLELVQIYRLESGPGALFEVISDNNLCTQELLYEFLE